jgi:hypothetical protein
MTFKHPYIDNLTPAAQDRTITEIDRVLHAVFDTDQNPDPDDVQRLYDMLRPGKPEEFGYVTIGAIERFKKPEEEEPF